MTFDEAYEQYKKDRALLREAQGELSKALHSREKLDKEIKELVRKYKTRYANLVHSQDILKPELDKEVASHAKPAQYEETEDQPAESADNRKADENGTA